MLIPPMLCMNAKILKKNKSKVKNIAQEKSLLTSSFFIDSFNTLKAFIKNVRIKASNEVFRLS
jgi:hypothetical protein